ncbi:MAG: beta-glycosidase, partial [Alistipes sp.]|nr:beta-glycosidase [Alistipes sp.]
IYINGHKLARLEGAFIRGKYDVTELVHEGRNALAVEIIKNEHIGAIKEKYEVNTDFNGGILGADNPTFHATIGWDWISTIRGRNIGIYNDVYLTSSGEVTLQDPFVQTTLSQPDRKATLTPEIFVTNHSTSPVAGSLKGKIGDITFEQSVELSAGEKRVVKFAPSHFSQLSEQALKLWWPKGYGEPYLYDAEFEFAIDGKISDKKEFKVGIRQMEFNEDNGILSLFVNGRRFIGRGGNWGFGENNLNYRGREYDIAVAHHANMNFTMMRNWVGQIGDEELYEACDRHGIMIWQDFWLANPVDGPNPYDNEMFIANAEDYVRRIRSHASLGIYCGRNEGYPPKVIDDALRRIVKDEHPGMHYISSSADDVVTGHGPYRALPAKEYFTLENGKDKFHSERGMPNVMNYESLARTLRAEDLWPQSNKWGQHDYTMAGAQGGESFNAIIEKGFGTPTSAKEFTELAQWVNYDGYRAMFESRSLNRKGLLLWMTHPAWPSMVWQTYDYYFEPTAAYFGCKKGNEPLHVQWNSATNDVEVVNYSAGNHPSLTVRAQLINIDGSVAWEKSAEVASSEDTTLRPFALEFPASLSSAHFVKLWLMDGEDIVSDNFYVRGTEEGNYQALRQMPHVKLEQSIECERSADGTWRGTLTLTNATATPALMVRVNVVGKEDGDQILPIFYSDNYFSLLPAEKKQITFHFKD